MMKRNDVYILEDRGLLYISGDDSKEFLQVHSETQVCLKIPFILTFV